MATFYITLTAAALPSPALCFYIRSFFFLLHTYTSDIIPQLLLQNVRTDGQTDGLMEKQVISFLYLSSIDVRGILDLSYLWYQERI